MPPVQYGLVRADEIRHAAAIYVRSFPARVGKLFRSDEPARAFYADLLELVRRAHSQTFLAARCDGRLVGFLALTIGGTRLIATGFRTGFIIRSAVRALVGGYGAPHLLAARMLAAAREREPDATRALELLPHVYVIAVDDSLTGHGVGSGLLACARAESVRRGFDRLWLRVEATNAGAIRLYERFGFRTTFAAPTELVMVLVLTADPAAPE